MTTPDPEKKKYFKIQANHVAPPGSQYSKESVKRKRTEQEVGIATPETKECADLFRNTTKKSTSSNVNLEKRFARRAFYTTP